MAPKKLTEYERRRLENIKRNEEMLAALNVHSKIEDLSAASTKRLRAQTKITPKKKPKPETPLVPRRSLRSRGMPPPPDASTEEALKNDDSEETPKLKPNSDETPKLKRTLGPISMRDAYCGDATEQTLIETIKGVSKNSSQVCCGGENYNLGYPIRVSGCVDLGSVRLEPDNVARVVPGRIWTVRFFPSMDMKLVAVGNMRGNIGFWNADAAKEEDGDGVYLYRPHSAPVSGIVVQPCLLSKVYSSCFDGFLQLMDVEKEFFNLLYSSDHAIFAIAQQPNDTKSLYFAEGQGIVKMWDERTGKALTPWTLHNARINTIDFSADNTNIVATSSSDGSACIWDLRYIDAVGPKWLKKVSHKRAVQSAYFSPSGSCLATTSFDDNVGLLTGANFEDLCMIHHDNQTGRWISPFRAIWGWDDSYLFIGSMKRAVDIISTARRSFIGTLESPHVSAIQCRFDVHPYKIGMLAGATSGGQIYIWTTD